ncbi:hypothetical protein PINS_up019964 [Pythium insidiosum]|nr:hypothetical protein PINS_up019964 [Pythium insidiosum]
MPTSSTGRRGNLQTTLHSIDPISSWPVTVCTMSPRFPSLVRVLHAFLGPQCEELHTEGAAPSRIAIFAATIRNQATFEAFLSTLAQHGITYEDINDSVARSHDSRAVVPV